MINCIQERVLGVLWNVSTDSLGFNVTLPQKPLTKRGILSTLSSLYDPLGLAAPVMLSPKLLLQDLCRVGFSWDEELTTNYVTEWKKWINSLTDLNQLKVPRCYKPTEFGTVTTIEIHHFADASSAFVRSQSYCRYQLDPN